MTTRPLDENPFGFSARRIVVIYCGMKRDMSLNSEWKKRYRTTKHIHSALTDTISKAEALLEFKKLDLNCNNYENRTTTIKKLSKPL